MIIRALSAGSAPARRGPGEIQVLNSQLLFIIFPSWAQDLTWPYRKPRHWGVGLRHVKHVRTSRNNAWGHKWLSNAFVVVFIFSICTKRRCTKKYSQLKIWVEYSNIFLKAAGISQSWIRHFVSNVNEFSWFVSTLMRGELNWCAWFRHGVFLSPGPLQDPERYNILLTDGENRGSEGL